jgi:hypothetical protein
MMKRKKLASLALAGVLALGLSACGDDDDLDDGTTIVDDGVDDTLTPDTTMVTETTAAG